MKIFSEYRRKITFFDSRCSGYFSVVVGPMWMQQICSKLVKNDTMTVTLCDSLTLVRLLPYVSSNVT